MSSLTIVPWPWPSATVAPVTFVTLTRNVSSGSTAVSPLTRTLEGVGRVAGRRSSGRSATSPRSRRGCRGAAVRRRDVEGHAAGACGRREADGEREGRRARVALALRDVVDREGGARGARRSSARAMCSAAGSSAAKSDRWRRCPCSRRCPDSRRRVAPRRLAASAGPVRRSSSLRSRGRSVDRSTSAVARRAGSRSPSAAMWTTGATSPLFTSAHLDGCCRC